MRKVLYILGQLKDEDIETLLRLGRRRRVPPGETLVAEGHPIDFLYVLVSGELSVTARDLGGREINRLKSGEIIGELSFLESRPPSATVTAVSEAVVLAVDRVALSRELERDTAFAARFYKALGQFLAHRLRRLPLGFGDPKTLKEREEKADELEEDFLDQVDRAAARFGMMMARLRGEGIS